MNQTMTGEFDRYLGERGFQLRQGIPTIEDRLPFLILRKPYQATDNMPILAGLEDQIIYVHSLISFGGGWSKVEPQEVAPSQWALRIAEGCAAAELKERRLKTRPGDTIDIYVLDASWMEVANNLVSMYPSRNQ